MAKSTNKTSTRTKVTRISANTETASNKKTATRRVIKSDQSDKVDHDATEKSREAHRFYATSKKETRAEKHALATDKTTRNPFRAFWIYVKGAWTELREVRWPTRHATWSMTGALLGFTAFFVLIILLLDGAFQWLFNILLGS